MAEFGGVGGISGGVSFDYFEGDLFAESLNRALGDDMRRDREVCREVWSALANVDWRHDNGDTAGWSFRAAGDLIAAIRGEGDYLIWYCCAPYPRVSARVADAMAAEGWHVAVMDYD